MKKIILAITLLLGVGSAFAMDWVEYEIACYKLGVEPSYEMYEKACEYPQCYGDAEEILLAMLAK